MLTPIEPTHDIFCGYMVLTCLHTIPHTSNACFRGFEKNKDDGDRIASTLSISSGLETNLSAIASAPIYTVPSESRRYSDTKVVLPDPFGPAITITFFHNGLPFKIGAVRNRTYRVAWITAYLDSTAYISDRCRRDTASCVRLSVRWLMLLCCSVLSPAGVVAWQV